MRDMFLHFIPKHDWENKYHGTYKDLISRVNWLQHRFSGYRQILITDDDPACVDAVLRVEMVKGALVEYSFYPQIVKRLKQRVPRAWVAVRSINLEPLQHFDNTQRFDNIVWFPQCGLLWMLYGMARLLKKDIETKCYSDAVLSINEWENRVYWNQLPGKASIEWLPYRCPDHLLPQNSIPFEKRKIIACLPTSNKNRKSWDLVIRFQKFAKLMRLEGSQYEFVITGKVQDWGLPKCSDVCYTGFIDNLNDFMGSCRAVAILSPLGYGFKTTIADAFAAGAHVIVHPKLIRRSPKIVQPFLIPFDPEDSAGALLLIDAIEQNQKGSELHGELCNRADAVMNEYFGKKL